MELSKFLRARLDEDEASAVDGGGCHCGEVKRPDCADRIVDDVEAKRRIVEAYEFYVLERLVMPASDLAYGRLCALEAAVRMLTDPWADHPDYDPAWRVDVDPH